MPEKQLVNIEKQEAGRDLFNVAGNLIINPITHEPVYIPSIQSVLRKGETTDGDFFKKEPEWVDYEQGFIVERKEVDEIIKRLENNKIQLVLGAPASGKSIILKNVGFRLAKEKKKVYVVELKKHPQDEVKLFFENIPKMDNENSIFIIEDAHLKISDCERLIRNFKGTRDGKLIIGSRETKEIIEGNPTETSEFERLSKTAIKIKAEDVTEEMIKIFLKKQYNLDEDRIRTASGNLENFKKDLWYLSWALKVFDSDNYSVDENKIYKDIKKRIEIINAEDVFLPLSVFFRYEIPIERKFLEKQMGIEGSIINRIIGLQEIVETEKIRKPTMLSLHHSSIADLYFRTYQTYPSFGEEIKEKIVNQENDGDLEFCSFYRYITTTDPRNAVDVISSLGRDSSNKIGGRKLIKNLIEEYKIQFLIKNGINKEDDLGKVEWCLLGIAGASKETAFKFVDSVSARINKEDDIEKVGSCVSHLAKASKEVAMKLVDNISARINKEDDIEKVGSCIFAFREEKEVALKLLDTIDIDALSSKIDKEEDMEKIMQCYLKLAWINQEYANEIFNRLNPKMREELEKSFQKFFSKHPA